MLMLVTTALSGLLTGLSLIVAIGAQNTFVLRQGLMRNHVGIAVLICICADVLLIAAGTAGLGIVVQEFPSVLVVLKWAGAAYLAFLAYQSFRRAAHKEALDPTAATRLSLKAVAGTTLAMTFLNPHVYLDTVVLLGALANQHPGEQWFFAAGAMLGSVIWFIALGFGAQALAPLVKSPRTWRIIDLVIGVILTVLAIRLATLPV